MPESRVRKPRRRSSRRVRRAPSADSGRVRVATLRPGQDMAHLITVEDLEHFEAHIDAAARGDAVEALWHLDETLQVEGSLIPSQLRELVVLGDEAPGWMYSRWAVAQAYRWLLHLCDRRTDDAVRQLMVASHVEHVERVCEDKTSFIELGTSIAAGDRLCEQLATFDYGGLADFLETRADPALIDRCDQIREWATTRMGGYVLESAEAGFIRVRDLQHDVRLDVLNIGALTDRGLDVPVIGRVVPIASAPGLMFESRPISVDRQTAEDVAAASTHEDPAYWITAIGDGRYAERLEPLFSCRGGTLFSSDIVPMTKAHVDRLDACEPPGRLIELLDQGLDELEANGVMVAEVALLCVASGQDAATAVAPHVAAVILEPRVFRAIKRFCVGPEHQRGWRALTECSAEPYRSRCAELAERCAGGGGASC